ncbi:unnamed protein product [Phytomonas sp. Hart1]|nr:unnamed protein product [Phytomonas sp. Hart1]|eukprot:CCW72313.1 unnamed protein product [Phytomonas sp. isolate Hart1]
MIEVATLAAGDFCGELELLGYDPNERPGEGVVWGEAYWREALLKQYSARVDPAMTLMSLCSGTTAKFAPKGIETPVKAKTADKLTETDRKEEDRCDNTLFSADTPLPPIPSSLAAASVVDEEGDDNKEDHQQNERSDKKNSVLRTTLAQFPRTRIATVRAKTSAIVYRLGYDDCRALFSDKIITRLREYVRGYPSNDDLSVVHEAQNKWRKYRTKIVDEIMCESRQSRW